MFNLALHTALCQSGSQGLDQKSRIDANLQPSDLKNHALLNPTISSS